MTKLTIKPNEKPTAQVVKGKTKRKTKESGDSCCSAFIQFAIAVAIIFGCTATYLYRSKVLPVYSTKERGVDKFSIGDISSVLCQQYEVNVGRNADIFLVDGEAKISSDKREVVTLSEKDYISHGEYAYYDVYLLKGSQIKVKGCQLLYSASDVEILIIQGNDNWMAYQQGKCSDCLEKRVIIRAGESCKFDDVEHYVHSSEHYYIVLTQYDSQYKHHRSRPTIIYSQLTLIKTIYDLTRVVQGCLGRSSCKFNLTYASNHNIIAMIHSKPNFHNLLTFVSQKCILRNMFWGGIFGILPIALLLFCGSCFCFCAAFEKSAARENRKKQIKQAIVNDEEHVVKMNPPSYNESDTDPLPSYDSLA